ncbi:protein translocase subunit SecA2, chloroplastic isoform X1 [Tanacetum coccineum]
MSQSLFTRIVREVTNNAPYFQPSSDCTRRVDISSLMKCSSAIRQSADVMNLYGDDFLREPTNTDVEKLYDFHEKKHGFPMMLGSIAYTEWFVLVKSISQSGSNDAKQIRYEQVHETTRKDVERAFGVLKKK